MTEEYMLKEVAPRLRAGIGPSIARAGGEDDSEILQDGLVIALGLLRSAESKGKKVSPGNIAHFTIKLLRAGRRSAGYRKNDVLHPAAHLNGHSKVQSMDAPMSEGENGEEPLTLHDSLASREDDPATAAARRMDWERLLDTLDRTAKAILMALAEGRELTLLVHRLKRSRSSLQNDKQRLGRLVHERLGPNILVQAQARPLWVNTLDAIRERLDCRAERRAA